uniref:Uncharacterized protein n=1 Tax=Papilio polytes TaxID=76194 RepID=I4DS93_PAPPL|nr:unknown unsecreted protein [Papilio polytes]
MKITKKDGSEGSRTKRAGGMSVGGLLPPPPGGSRLPPPPSPQHAPAPTPAGPAPANTSEWGDFNSASATAQKPVTPANQQNWVQF